MTGGRRHPGNGTTNDDKHSGGVRDGAAAMQEGGDEPNDRRERRPDAAVSEGFEEAAQLSLASWLYAQRVCWLPADNGCWQPAFVCSDRAVRHLLVIAVIAG